jgi:hypothetical protein
LASLRDEIKDALERADFEKVAELALRDKKVFRILISLSYDKQETLCWRAIEAMGRAAGAVGERDPSTVRNIIQRLIWSVSEESGGIGWSAPEMLGEIVVNSPGISADIPPIILSFHEEESFLKGVLWAMGRIADAGLAPVDGSAELALKSLDHKDPAVRGLSLYLVSALKIQNERNKMSDMAHDTGTFKIYENHELVETTVGNIARRVWTRRGEVVSSFPSERQSGHGDKVHPRQREDKDKTPRCPFCALLLREPKNIKTTAGGFIGGRCECGAVYACDPTGHNVGEAYLDALEYASGEGNDIFGSLKSDEHYEEAVFNYDLRTHRLWNIKDIRRDYSGKIVFIKVAKNDK